MTLTDIVNFRFSFFRIILGQTLVFNLVAAKRKEFKLTKNNTKEAKDTGDATPKQGSGDAYKKTMEMHAQLTKKIDAFVSKVKTENLAETPQLQLLKMVQCGGDVRA